MQIEQYRQERGFILLVSHWTTPDRHAAIGATSTPHHRITIKEGEYPGNGTKSTTGLAGPLQARTPRALQTSPKDVTSEGTRTLERDPGGANRHVDSQRWGHTRREPSGANRRVDSQRWGHTRREPSGPTDTSTHSGGDTLGRDPDGANNNCYLIVHTKTHVIRLVYVCE